MTSYLTSIGSRPAIGGGHEIWAIVAYDSGYIYSWSANVPDPTVEPPTWSNLTIAGPSNADIAMPPTIAFSGSTTLSRSVNVAAPGPNGTLVYYLHMDEIVKRKRRRLRAVDELSSGKCRHHCCGGWNHDSA
jgi:hypothetical protein